MTLKSQWDRTGSNNGMTPQFIHNYFSIIRNCLSHCKRLKCSHCDETNERYHSIYNMLLYTLLDAAVSKQAAVSIVSKPMPSQPSAVPKTNETGSQVNQDQQSELKLGKNIGAGLYEIDIMMLILSDFNSLGRKII